jgi:hypothetical protein
MINAGAKRSGFLIYSKSNPGTNKKRDLLSKISFEVVV